MIASKIRFWKALLDRYKNVSKGDEPVLQLQELAEDQVRVLLMRHEEHVSQVLTPGAIVRLQTRGKVLKESGVDLTCVLTSPQPRCWRSCEKLLAVTKQVVTIVHVQELNDISRLGADVEALRARAKEEGIAPHALEMITVDYDEYLVQQGTDGVAVIRHGIQHLDSGALLVCSHSGSNLEPILLEYLGENALIHRGAVVAGEHPRVRMFGPGEIAEVILRKSGEFVDLQYLNDADLLLALR